jgi:hypothetical protein
MKLSSKKLLAIIAILTLSTVLMSCTDREGCPGKITRSNTPIQHPV